MAYTNDKACEIITLKICEACESVCVPCYIPFTNFTKTNLLEYLKYNNK